MTFDITLLTEQYIASMTAAYREGYMRGYLDRDAGAAPESLEEAAREFRAGMDDGLEHAPPVDANARLG